MQFSLYRFSLRVGVMVMASVLLFESGVLSPVTHQLAKNTANYVASAVGMFASVEPNEINVITSALTQRERELDEREKSVVAREMSVNRYGEAGAGLSQRTSTFILSTILFIMLVLIVLNFSLDFIYRREARKNEQFS